VVVIGSRRSFAVRISAKECKVKTKLLNRMALLVVLGAGCLLGAEDLTVVNHSSCAFWIFDGEPADGEESKETAKAAVTVATTKGFPVYGPKDEERHSKGTKVSQKHWAVVTFPEGTGHVLKVHETPFPGKDEVPAFWIRAIRSKAAGAGAASSVKVSVGITPGGSKAKLEAHMTRAKTIFVEDALKSLE
jgi:hypothetical protein